ncbi:MAG: cysteine desulfurase [Neptunomonas phycophila]|uniref:cysteine desulfurase family protein n=1 Tax=Neptunomonas phycophila TaxID=1572645 RepID=UPI003B8B3184
MYYFDSAGSFPILETSKQSLTEELTLNPANPSADHECGLRTSRKVEAVRKLIADVIGAYPSEIIFTGGATESNNLALKSIISVSASDKKHIITTKYEHKCILSISKYLETKGYEVTYISPNTNGMIDSSSVADAIRPDTALVSVMHVNNELGTVNPIEEIGEICLSNHVMLHTDCAQSFGKLEIDVDDMNIDFMSISGHKIGASKGIGAVYIRNARDLNIEPVIHGAGQEQGLRGGTVASPLVASFGEAVKHFPQLYAESSILELRSYMLSQLDELNIAYKVNGNGGLPHIMSITFPEIDITSFIQRTRGMFCIAQGSACSSKEIEPSHVLKSIGLDRLHAERTIRLSFDFDTSRESIDALLVSLKEEN